MENIFYFDTSIWLDHYLERDENGRAALKWILKIIAEDLVIIFSNYVEKELKDVGLSQSEVNSLLAQVKPDHLKRVQVTKVQFEESRKVAKQRNVPLGDAIPAIIARDNSAVFVSRDHDFDRLKDIVITKKPEDLL